MMLRKDDPVYYKKKISDLLKQAANVGLSIQVQNLKDGVIISFVADNGEVSGIELKE